MANIQSEESKSCSHYDDGLLMCIVLLSDPAAKQPEEMKCSKCQLGTDFGIREAISAVNSSIDSLVTEELIEFLFSELLERAPEDALTKPVLKAVFEKLTFPLQGEIPGESFELPWVDIWGNWAMALSKFEHKQDLFNLLANIRIKSEHTSFFFAIQLLAISECYKVILNNSIASKDSHTKKENAVIYYDVKALERGVFDIYSEIDLLKFKRDLEDK